MADGGKGKGASPPAGGGASPSKTKPRAEQSVAVKMGWAALRGRVPGSYREQGLVLKFPNPTDLIEGGSGHNVAIVPMPFDLIKGVSEEHPAICQPVKGRLPELHLYPEMTGNNLVPWSKYIAAHPPRFANVSPSDFRNRTLSLPKG